MFGCVFVTIGPPKMMAFIFFVSSVFCRYSLLWILILSGCQLAWTGPVWCARARGVHSHMTHVKIAQMSHYEENCGEEKCIPCGWHNGKLYYTIWNVNKNRRKTSWHVFFFFNYFVAVLRMIFFIFWLFFVSTYQRLCICVCPSVMLSIHSTPRDAKNQFFLII